MTFDLRLRNVLVVSLMPLFAVHAQEAVVSIGVRAGHGFSGYASTPISPTAVLHSLMDATDTAATLGFAIAIRGPSGWYNAHTTYGEISEDSLPIGVIGQWWQVGERRYRFLYNQTLKTLALFDTTVDMSRSRVVLVTLPNDLAGRATVTLGQPVALEMLEPTSFANVFLRKAPEVRAFARPTPP